MLLPKGYVVSTVRDTTLPDGSVMLATRTRDEEHVGEPAAVLRLHDRVGQELGVGLGVVDGAAGPRVERQRPGFQSSPFSFRC